VNEAYRVAKPVSAALCRTIAATDDRAVPRLRQPKELLAELPAIIAHVFAISRGQTDIRLTLTAPGHAMIGRIGHASRRVGRFRTDTQRAMAAAPILARKDGAPPFSLLSTQCDTPGSQPPVNPHCVKTRRLRRLRE